jgi:hypothetical protein
MDAKGPNELRVWLTGQNLGTAAEVREIYQPVFAIAQPGVNRVVETSFLDAHELLTDATPEGYFETRCHYAESLPDAAYAEMADWVGKWPRSTAPPDGVLSLFPWGGAMGATAPDATAFVHRTARHLVKVETAWGPEDSKETVQAGLDWLGGFYDAMQKYVTPQSYQNFPWRDLPNYATAYWGANLPRLVGVKKKYDPENVFNFAQSVPTVI